MRRKLRLRAETVRVLTASELHLAVGGQPDESIIYDCPTNASRWDRSCFASCTTVSLTTTGTTFGPTGP